LKSQDADGQCVAAKTPVLSKQTSAQMITHPKQKTLRGGMAQLDTVAGTPHLCGSRPAKSNALPDKSGIPSATRQLRLSLCPVALRREEGLTLFLFSPSP